MISPHHETFMEVARHLSFSKASQVLFLSQPAISKQIKALETHYQSNLFERKGNAIMLSKAGEILYQRLKEAKEIQNKLEYELSILKESSNAKGELKLGASTTVALYIIPKILSAFHQNYPEIRISLLNRNSETILKALLDQEIDIGIIESRNKISTVEYQDFMSDEVVAVCSPQSPIARKKQIQLKEIINYPIAMREQGSGTLTTVKQSLEQAGIMLSELKVGIRLAGTEALKNFLKEDNCLGFLPKRSILKELRDKELVSVHINGLKMFRTFCFIQRKGSNDPLNKNFIKFARKQYNQSL
jgi:DNA-binding transcriptional LysR family regulator